MSNKSHPLHRWLPYRLWSEDQKLLCYWLNTNEEQFTEPFFYDTIGKIKATHRGVWKNSVGELDMLKIWADDMDAIPPTAFIFHVSRCGSTLLTQMLGTDEQNIVLSEVPFFDELLRLPYQSDKVSKEGIGSLLTAAFRFYGQKRTGIEKQLFVKVDSWHICFYSELRLLFPDVPFILLYRTPDEVLASHQKLRGIQAVPGLIEPEVFGFDRSEILVNNLDAYMAKVLERYFEAYLEITENDPLSMLLNYNEGVASMMEKLAEFTGITFNEEQLELMNERSKYHSKHPNEVFAEERKPDVSPYLARAMELYRQTERKRQATHIAGNFNNV
jgi:hypothetical protein